jgi:1-acyl-sn-glycerol-3-phosphate acyltransferase
MTDKNIKQMKPSQRISSEDLSKRKFARKFLKTASRFAFWLLADLEIEGQENFPEEGAGPLLMVGNHFSMVDIAAFVRVAPYPAEFIGGAIFVNAPRFLAFLPRMWGYLPVFRGTGSSFALREAEKVLKRDGMLAIFPEGGSHGRMLRPPRPGTAFLATRTGARIIPIGLIGMDEVFEKLGKLKRPKIKIVVGEPFGPYKVTSKGKERREELDMIGNEIMGKIAVLIPPEKHGYLSDDPEIRAQVVDYPWEESREGEVKEAFNVR